MTDIPHSLQPKGNHLVEARQQHYDAAVKRRARSYPDVSAAGTLTDFGLQHLKLTGHATVENVLAGLLALASIGLKRTPNLSNEQIVSTIEGMTLLDAKAVLERVEKVSEHSVKKLSRAVAKQPKVMSTRELRERQKCPEIVAKLLGRFHALPWDACQDGHLVLRDVARAAGLVRWAHAQTAERSGRVHDAIGHCVLLGNGAREVWRHRRPLVVIDKLNAYTVKLVTDAWIYDPQVAVLYTGGQLESNPFEAWRIPLVCDTHGWLRALLAIEMVPAVIEPRLGGFTMTAACGRVDPHGFKEDSKLPAWMKTLAEIGLIAAYEDEAKRQNAPAIRGADAVTWHERFQALLGVTLAIENDQTHCAHMLASGIEEAAKQRQNFIRLRQDVTLLLERLAQSGSEAHAAREATRQTVKRERRARELIGLRRTERTGPAFNEDAFNQNKAIETQSNKVDKTTTTATASTEAAA